MLKCNPGGLARLQWALQLKHLQETVFQKFDEHVPIVTYVDSLDEAVERLHTYVSDFL